MSGERAFGYLFDALPPLLRQRGFTVGVDQCLRMQEVLDRAGPFRPDSAPRPRDLCTLLCPIFARSKEQQRVFHEVFREHYAALDPDSPRAAPEPPQVAKPPVRARRWPYLGVAVLVVSLALAAAFYQHYFRAIDPPRTPAPPAAPSQGGEPATPPLSDAPVTWVLPAANLARAPWYEPLTHPLSWALLAAPLIFYLFAQYSRPVRQAQLRRGEPTFQPPYDVPLEVQGPILRDYESELFYTSARKLRQRQLGDVLRLDLKATLLASLRAGDYPTLRFRPVTRRPEYLILIEQASPMDHLARLFAELAFALQRDAVDARVFFFQDDPRVLMETAPRGAPKTVRLADLERRCPDHRLLIVSRPAALLDPVTGRLAGWISGADAWAQRALFSFAAPSPREVEEIGGRGGFVVLPATLHGLERLIERFDAPTRPDLRPWPAALDPAPSVSGLEPLREYLGPALFDWLCACAVYPRLDFDLTLHLAARAGLPPGVLAESSMLRLFRLEWFRRGAIPEARRQELAAALDPARAEAVRAAIVELLERSPAAPGTWAALSREFQVAAYRATRQPAERGRLRARMARILAWSPEKIVQDYALLRFLEAGPAPGWPARLLARLSFKGARSLGFAPVTRAASLSAATVVAVSVAFWSAPAVHPGSEQAGLRNLDLELVYEDGQGIASQVAVELLQQGGPLQSRFNGWVNRTLKVSGIDPTPSARYLVAVTEAGAATLTRNVDLNTDTRARITLSRPAPPPSTSPIPVSITVLGLSGQPEPLAQVSNDANLTARRTGDGTWTFDVPRDFRARSLEVSAELLTRSGRLTAFSRVLLAGEPVAATLRLAPEAAPTSRIRVVDERGFPIAGAEVTVFPKRTKGFTDRKGEFIFDETEAKRLQVAAPGYYTVVAQTFHRTVVLSRATGTITVTSDPPGKKFFITELLADRWDMGTPRTTPYSVQLPPGEWNVYCPDCGSPEPRRVTVKALEGVTVAFGPPEQGVISLAATPASIWRGEAAELRWELPGKTPGVIEPGVGAVAGSGSREVRPSQTTTYSLSVERPQGTTVRQATVRVTQPYPVQQNLPPQARVIRLESIVADPPSPLTSQILGFTIVFSQLRRSGERVDYRMQVHNWRQAEAAEPVRLSVEPDDSFSIDVRAQGGEAASRFIGHVASGPAFSRTFELQVGDKEAGFRLVFSNQPEASKAMAK